MFRMLNLGMFLDSMERARKMIAYCVYSFGYFQGKYPLCCSSRVVVLMQVETHGFGRDDRAKRVSILRLQIFGKISWNILTFFSHTSEIASFKCRFQHGAVKRGLPLLPSSSPASCLETYFGI